MNRCLTIIVLSLAVSGCSDDAQPADQGVTSDGKKAADQAKPGDQSGSWPEASPADQGGWKCTPGAANMCDDYKTQYCLNGICTACPANKTDCDRKGDCECAGVCDGTKCKTQ
jgi:hypothetical protein